MPQPIYQQIADDLRKQIESRTLKPDKSYRDWITARALDDNEQRFLGIAHDSFIVNVGNPPDPQYETNSAI